MTSIKKLEKKLQQQVPKEVRELQLKNLRPSTRRFLSKKLDPLTRLGQTKLGVTQDWQGLAELLDFDNDTIQQIENRREGSPTEMVMELWVRKPGSNVNELLQKLMDLERFDILQDQILYNQLKGDYESWVKAETERQHKQKGEITKTKADLMLERGEEQPLVIDGDVLFDAFVSFCDDDIEFVLQLIEMLEEKNHLRLCLNFRNMMPGGAKFHDMALVMAERCRKVILVFSPSFLQTEECIWQQRVAHELSPAACKQIMIPLIHRPCQLPVEMRFVAAVDFTNPRIVDFAWPRLVAAMKLKRRIDPTDLERLSSVSQGESCNLHPTEKRSATKSYRDKFSGPPQACPPPDNAPRPPSQSGFVFSPKEEIPHPPFPGRASRPSASENTNDEEELLPYVGFNVGLSQHNSETNPKTIDIKGPVVEAGESKPLQPSFAQVSTHASTVYTVDTASSVECSVMDSEQEWPPNAPGTHLDVGSGQPQLVHPSFASKPSQSASGNMSNISPRSSLHHPVLSHSNQAPATERTESNALSREDIKYNVRTTTTSVEVPPEESDPGAEYGYNDMLSHPYMPNVNTTQKLSTTSDFQLQIGETAIDTIPCSIGELNLSEKSGQNKSCNSNKTMPKRSSGSLQSSHSASSNSMRDSQSLSTDEYTVHDEGNDSSLVSGMYSDFKFN